MKKFIITVAVAGFLALAGSASASTFVYTSGLIKVGSMGSQVADLQTCMNGLGYSTGIVDGKFGPMTKSGVIAFQNAKGLYPDGIIGTMTGPQFTVACAEGSTGDVTLPEGCTSTAGYSSTTGNPCSDTTSTTGNLPAGCTAVDTPMYSPLNGQRCVLGEGGDDTGYEGTEGSVKNYSLGAADESQALEGENDVEIYAVDVELDALGDLALGRLDVWFANGDVANGADLTWGTGDDVISSDLKPWRYFKSVSVLVDGNEVATLSADSKSDWSDYSNGEITTTNDDKTPKEYRMRFSGLDKVFKSNETTKVAIAVTMQNIIDSTDQSAKWYVEVDDDSGFRWVDGTGFMFSGGAGGTTLEDMFSIGNEETASMDITLAIDNPDSKVIGIDKYSDTDDQLLAMYNVEEKQGIDVTVDTIDVEFEVVDVLGGITPAGVGTLVKKAYLKVGGSVIASKTVAATSLTETVTFDNLDLDISGNSNKDVSVFVDFEDTNNGARYDDGTTIKVSDFDITEITDANDNDEGSITGITSVLSGEVHSLALGVANVSGITNEVSTNDDDSVGYITYNFTISADSDDVTFDVANNSNVDGADDIMFTVLGTDADIAGTTLTLLSGDATYGGGIWTILDGQDATFALDTTLTTVDSDDNGTYRVRLDKVAGVSFTDKVSSSVNLSN